MKKNGTNLAISLKRYKPSKKVSLCVRCVLYGGGEGRGGVEQANSISTSRRNIFEERATISCL